MDILLQTLVGFVLGIVGAYIATPTQPPIQNIWQKRLDEQLADEAALREATASGRSFRDELRRACRELSKDRRYLGEIPNPEREIWLLLGDASFQDDLTDWLMAGGIAEGGPIRERLERRMQTALERGGATAEQIASFKADYFEMLDRAIFSNPLLAAWRHQLSLDYLRREVAAVRVAAEKAAGIFSEEERQAAMQRYFDVALRAWDIIDLSNLPEGDIHIATQKLMLRQLYMPLRVVVELERAQAGEEDAFARLEQRREARRLREAGRLTVGGLVMDDESGRWPVGVRLGTARRLVVLGDPGGGKSTLLRWIATCYLLRLLGDSTYDHIPDHETLPNWRQIPVLIRCRDLGETDLCRSFADFLGQHLRKTELLPDEAKVLEAVILERMAAGEVLLLVDGLDEITNPAVRVQFCQELERTAERYPNAPIVVTSRIVGYRDMPYRIGRSFEHGTIADLSREDKDSFAQRWIEVTDHHQPAAERERRTGELIDALHSSDRIERLTGNPMLLTTLALVKRKVGKLPTRRNKLYAEAVGVLLNWNPRYYEAIDEAEAVPQLAYIAYEMCRRGVQRLDEDDLLDLLDRVRDDYPNVRAIRRHEPQQFLDLLEARSSILIKSGGDWRDQRNRETPVWEFRHLTLQEYLAARALIDGRYPNRDRSQSLAQAVAPLAGTLKQRIWYRYRNLGFAETPELEVTDSWQETLRLLVAECKDDDVDDVLLAIATPLPDEDTARSERPRVVLAARCLADEPNVSEETVREILDRFAATIAEEDRDNVVLTPVGTTAIELAHSIWVEQLKQALMHEFWRRTADDYIDPGYVWFIIAGAIAPPSEPELVTSLSRLVAMLHSANAHEISAAAVAIAGLRSARRIIAVPGMIDGLLDVLQQAEPLRTAAAWALSELSLDHPQGIRARYVWQPQAHEVSVLINVLQARQTTRTPAVEFLVFSLSRSHSAYVFEPLITQLDDEEAKVRQAAAIVLGHIGDSRAVAPLVALLDDHDTEVRQVVAEALGQLGDGRAVEALIARLDDPERRVRLSIVGALGEMGDERAVEPLIARLDNPDTLECWIMAWALGQLGDSRAVEPLVARLGDGDGEVRGMVAEALGQLGDSRAVGPLVARLNDEEGQVRRAVAEALGQLGDHRAIEPLLKRLDDPDTDVRLIVVAALHRIDPSRGLGALATALSSEYREEREIAVRAFAGVRDKTVARLLSRDLDALNPWLDPRESITLCRVEEAGRRLGIDAADVLARYEALAVDLPLKLEWRMEVDDAEVQGERSKFETALEKVAAESPDEYDRL